MTLSGKDMAQMSSYKAADIISRKVNLT